MCIRLPRLFNEFRPSERSLSGGPGGGLGKAFCALQRVAVRQAWHQRRQCSGRLLEPIRAGMAVVTACRVCPNTFLYDADAPSRMCPLFYDPL